MYDLFNYIESNSGNKKTKLFEKKSVLDKIKMDKLSLIALIKNSDDSSLIGVIDKRGNVYKLKNQITTELLKEKKHRKDISQFLPILSVTNDTQTDLIIQTAKTIINLSTQDDLVKRLQQLIVKGKKLKYNIYYDIFRKKIYVVKKTKQAVFDEIQTRYEKELKNLSGIKSMLLHNQHQIVQNIKIHRDNYSEYLLKYTRNNNDISECKRMYKSEKRVVQKYLKEFLESIEEQKKDALKLKFDNKKEYILQKERQINQLRTIIENLSKELDKSTEAFRDAEILKLELLKNIDAKNKILKDITEIKSKTMEYYNNWLYWNETNGGDENFLKNYKKYLIKEIQLIKEKFKELEHLIDDDQEKIKFKQNVSELELFIQKFFTEQFSEIGKKQAVYIESRQMAIRKLERELSTYKSDINEKLNKTLELIEFIKNKNQMESLSESDLYNFSDCLSNLKQFAYVNNKFVRFSKIITILHKIVDKLQELEKVDFDDTRLTIIEASDKEYYVNEFSDIKTGLDNVLEKIDIKKIHEDPEYIKIMSDLSVHKRPEISIGLCMKISNILSTYLTYKSDLDIQLNKISNFVEHIKTQGLSNSIKKQYMLLPRNMIKQKDYLLA